MEHNIFSKFLFSSNIDPSYIPESDVDDTDDEGDDEEDDEEEESHFSLETTKKYQRDETLFIVYESKLLELLKYCSSCGAVLTNKKEMKSTGSQLTLVLTCKNGNYKGFAQLRFETTCFDD